GNIVYLVERDCSRQRSHNKVVEVAQSIGLEEDLRDNINNGAVQLMENIKYINAGTVEFLVQNNEYDFIEVNPRVQVEHTITEMVTGVDIVQTQLKIADGLNIHSASIGIPKQKDIQTIGYAIQSRVTTEDPL